MLLENQKKTEIYRAVYTGQLDIIRIINLAGLKEYQEFYLDPAHQRSPKGGIIHLASIVDLTLRRRIVDFMIENLDTDKLKATTFHTYRVLALLEIIEEFPKDITLSYENFLKRSESLVENVEHRKAGVRSFLHSFHFFCDKKDNLDHPLESDIWYLEWFNISRDRDYSRRYNRFFFNGINDARNKQLVKNYVEYCLKNTELSVQTIFSRNSALKTLLNMIDKSYDTWTTDDGELLGRILREKYNDSKTIASHLCDLFQFNDYLLLHDYISENAIKGLRPLSRIGAFKYKTTAADHGVIIQIFNSLDSIDDERVVLCFLMIYCTGMRVSEACAIDFDCTEKREKGTFLKYYSLKMKKEVYNVIPCSLYDRIERFKKTHTKSGFLFPAYKPKNRYIEKPMATSYFYSKINDAMTANNVTNPDGSQYRFSPHSFRHLIAVKMRERKIPIQFIQEQLHHKSIEMTLQYIEYIDKVKIKKMDEYINVHGEVAGLKKDFLYSDDIDYANYIRKSLNAQMLPNGICARPIRLGRCPHGNTCLTCPDFRTSKDNLSTHKQQLERVERFLCQAKENGWLPQIETNEIIRKNLISIIEKLEEKSSSE